jgi:hypothetical protein
MYSFFMDQLHEQEFTLLLTNVPLDVVRACLHSCTSLTIGAWLLAHPNTLSFHLAFAHFLITLYIHLGIPHAIIVHLS